MDSTYLLLITGFGGVLIGSLSTVATVFLQLRSQDRRERLRQAATLALEEFKVHVGLAQSGGRPNVMPISVLCHFHAEVLAALDRGDLTVETMKGIMQRNGELANLAIEVSPVPPSARGIAETRHRRRDLRRGGV
jgi:hypothetical protein